MDVMKDAGATAIYGARASNGVIIITTKTGKAGHSEINLKAKLGFNYIHTPHKFIGARDYIKYQRLAYANAAWASTSSLTGSTPMGTGNKYNEKMSWNIMGYDPADATQQQLLEQGWEFTPDPLDPNKQIIFKDTNPSDYAFNNPSLTQDYNINMSGGNERGSYYAGLGYNKSEGIPVTSFYKRYSFVLNGSYQINNWLKSISNFNYNRANWQSMPGSQTSEANYFGRLLSLPHTARFVDEQGNPVLGTSVGDGNQYYQPEKWQIDNQTDKFTMSQSFEAKLMRGLTLKAMGTWYYSEGVYEYFTKDYKTNNNGSYNRNRSTSDEFGRDFSQTYNMVINYNGEVAKNHNIDVMLGTEYYDLKTRGFYAAGSGAPTDDFQDLELTSNKEGKRSIDSWHSQYRILSYFGRANYNFMSKYLFSAVFRYDGYSSLLGDNRWGFFPGLSAGWLFYQEDFVKNAIPALSFGKLRLSYGVNGNASSIGAYTLQGSYGSAQYNGNVGFLIGSLPNPKLKWERTRTAEVGVDLGFLNNRVNANITYYNRLTSDKHAAMSLPSTTGFSSITNNNGSFRNRGLEFELSGEIIKNKDMLLKAGANIAYNKNTIVKLPYNGLDNNRQGGQQIYTGNGDELKWVGGYQEGQEPGVIVAYVFDGIYRSMDEIPGNLVVKSGNDKGAYIYGPTAYAALTDAQKKSAIALQPGDAKWKDINGDGMIDSFDQVVVGNTMPHWIGGLNFTFAWKGFTLYTAMDFALGFWNYDNTTPWFLGDMQGTYNATTEVLDTWSPENVNAKYPRYVWADQFGAGNYYRTSTLFAHRGDYQENGASWNDDPFGLKTGYVQRYEYTLDLFRTFDKTDSRRLATMTPAYLMSNPPQQPDSLVGVPTCKNIGKINATGDRVFDGDDIYYRLPWVYLSLAEIANEEGNNSDVEKYINLVRKRAYGSNWSAAYQYTAGDYTTNTLAILHEKDKEFVQEGQRWWDLNRMTLTKGGEHLVFCKEGSVLGNLPILNKATEAHKVLWPLDKTILGNDPLLKQTPGYATGDQEEEQW